MTSRSYSTRSLTWHRGEDQGVDLPPASAVRNPHRCTGLDHGEPVQRPIRQPHSLPGQHLLDLHHRQRLARDPVTLAAADPDADLPLMLEQDLPGGAGPTGPGGQPR
jgi:hypothetical protein